MRLVARWIPCQSIHCCSSMQSWESDVVLTSIAGYVFDYFRRDQLQAKGDGYPRYRVRWRDEEGCLLCHGRSISFSIPLAEIEILSSVALLATRQIWTTLPPLFRQRRTQRRRFSLLRSLRNWKDDPLRRPDSKTHRRRRARLVRHGSLQHRGWMLRQVRRIDEGEGAGDFRCDSIWIYS